MVVDLRLLPTFILLEHLAVWLRLFAKWELETIWGKFTNLILILHTQCNTNASCTCYGALEAISQTPRLALKSQHDIEMRSLSIRVQNLDVISQVRRDGIVN
jgi:hypothetical protein